MLPCCFDLDTQKKAKTNKMSKHKELQIDPFQVLPAYKGC